MIRLLLIIGTLLMVGCLFDTAEKDSARKGKLSILVDNNRMARTTVGPHDTLSNVVTGRSVIEDPVYGSVEIVDIEWGAVIPIDYLFRYTLVSNDTNRVVIDSVVFSDSLTYVGVEARGKVVGSGLNGFQFPVRFQNSGYEGWKGNDTINGFGRFREGSYDSAVVMTVYGHDSITGVPAKLVVNFRAWQTISSLLISRKDGSARIRIDGDFEGDTVQMEIRRAYVTYAKEGTTEGMVEDVEYDTTTIVRGEEVTVEGFYNNRVGLPEVGVRSLYETRLHVLVERTREEYPGLRAPGRLYVKQE
jgi:hypothetical protein